jgi:hypothetical protein
MQTHCVVQSKFGIPRLFPGICTGVGYEIPTRIFNFPRPVLGPENRASETLQFEQFGPLRSDNDEIDLGRARALRNLEIRQDQELTVWA